MSFRIRNFEVFLTYPQGLPGPAGADGDRYLTLTTVMFSPVPTVSTITTTATVSTNLAYSPGNSVLVADNSNPLVNNFEARVISYDSTTGVIVLDTITNFNGSFSGVTVAGVNLDAIDGPRGPTGPTGADSTVPGPTGADSTVPGPTGPTGADSTVPGPTGADSTVPGPTGPTGADSTVPGPTGPTGADSTVPGPTGADSTVPGPTGPTGADSTVPGPTGPTGPTGADSNVTGPTGPAGSVSGSTAYGEINDRLSPSSTLVLTVAGGFSTWSTGVAGVSREMTLSTGPNTFTIIEDGDYKITCSFSVSSLAANTVISAAIFVDGIEVSESRVERSFQNTNASGAFSITDMRAMTAGEVVTLRFATNNNTTMTINNISMNMLKLVGNGVTGATGSTGPQGVTGATGVQGAAGPSSVLSSQRYHVPLINISNDSVYFTAIALTPDITSSRAINSITIHIGELDPAATNPSISLCLCVFDQSSGSASFTTSTLAALVDPVVLTAADENTYKTFDISGSGSSALGSGEYLYIGVKYHTEDIQSISSTLSIGGIATNNLQSTNLLTDISSGYRNSPLGNLVDSITVSIGKISDLPFTWAI